MAVPVCECKQGIKRSTTCFLQCEKKKEVVQVYPSQTISRAAKEQDENLVSIFILICVDTGFASVESAW